jgi:hypothetical protein
LISEANPARFVLPPTFGMDFIKLIPPSESDQNNAPDPGLGTATARKSDLLLIAVSINGCQGF